MAIDHDVQLRCDVDALDAQKVDNGAVLPRQMEQRGEDRPALRQVVAEGRAVGLLPRAVIDREESIEGLADLVSVSGGLELYCVGLRESPQQAPDARARFRRHLAEQRFVAVRKFDEGPKRRRSASAGPSPFEQAAAVLDTIEQERADASTLEPRGEERGQRGGRSRSASAQDRLAKQRAWRSAPGASARIGTRLCTSPPSSVTIAGVASSSSASYWACRWPATQSGSVNASRSRESSSRQ